MTTPHENTKQCSSFSTEQSHASPESVLGRNDMQLINADGQPIGATKEEAAVLTLQTIAANAREVLAALKAVGIKIPYPIEIRTSNQIVTLLEAKETLVPSKKRPYRKRARPDPTPTITAEPINDTTPIKVPGF